MRDAIYSFTGQDVFYICTMCTKNINAEQKPHSNTADWYSYVVNTIFQNKKLFTSFLDIYLSES